jgi:hypothetical protein
MKKLIDRFLHLFCKSLMFGSYQRKTIIVRYMNHEFGAYESIFLWSCHFRLFLVWKRRELFVGMITMSFQQWTTMRKIGSTNFYGHTRVNDRHGTSPMLNIDMFSSIIDYVYRHRLFVTMTIVLRETWLVCSIQSIDDRTWDHLRMNYRWQIFVE